MKLTTLPKAMLFDLDGTLAHTLPQLKCAVCAIARDLGISEPNDEQMANYVGNGLNMLLARMIKGQHDVTVEEIDSATMDEARRLFGIYYMQGLSRNFVIYEGVKEGLREMHKLGIKLGVVTNKPHRFAIPLLKYMGIDKYLDGALGGEILNFKKPDPRPLYYVMEAMGLDSADASSMVMVGDSINDIKAGINAGMTTVAFTYGYSGGYDIKTCCQADYYFDKFTELNALIASLSN